VTASDRDETEADRLNRQLDQLLQELRVAMPGVQVLFAFLLVVPFQQRFTTVTEFQKTIYFVGLLCAAAATILLIAPSANHRILFRAREKQRLLRRANWMMIAGLGFLAAAVVCVVMLITDFLYGTATTAVVSALTALGFAVLWYLVPLRRRL
jgi:uncharacterized protein involved in cysteine biosynthesis